MSPSQIQQCKLQLWHKHSIILKKIILWQLICCYSCSSAYESRQITWITCLGGSEGKIYTVFIHARYFPFLPKVMHLYFVKENTFPFTAFFSKLKSIVGLMHFWDKVRRPTLGRDLAEKFYKGMLGIKHHLKRIISTKHGQAKYSAPQQFEIDSLVCWTLWPSPPLRYVKH